MPATLTLFLNGQELKKYEITKDRVIIGRVPENDITLDNPTVSRKHMAIVKMGDAYQLQDLGSSSGTYVNGKKIASYFLNDGDEISVGQMVLRFALPAPPQEGDSEMTMVVTNEDIKKQLQMMHQAALAKGPDAPPAPAAAAAPTAPPKPPEPAKVEAPPPPKPPEPPKVEAPPSPKPPEPPKVEAPPPPKPPEPPKVEAPPPPKPPEPPKVEAPPPPKPPEPPKVEAPPPPKPPAPPKLELPPPPKPPAPPKIETSAPPKPPEPPKIEAPPPPKPPAPPKLEPPAPPKPPEPPKVEALPPKPPAPPKLDAPPAPKPAEPAAAEKPKAAPAHPKTELVSITGNPQPSASESALLATVRGPFLGGSAKPGETPPKPPAAPVPPKPAPPKAPPPPPNVPMESFEPTLISPPRSAPVAPAGQPAAPPVPRTPDGKPDIAAIAFDAGVTVSPAAIGGFNALSSQPNVQKPPQTPPAPGVIPTPVPPVQAPPKPPDAGAGGDIPVDQLLTPKRQRTKTQAIQPAPASNPPPAPPTLPPSQPVPPPMPPPIPQTQQPQPGVQPSVQPAGQPAAPMFAKPAEGSWGTTPPPQPVTDDERLWGMLANILGLFCWIGPILGLVLRPKSNFVKFHSLQYLFMAIAFTIVWFPVAWIVSFVTLMIHPILYFIWLGVSLLVSLGMLILVVVMALKANQGMLFKIPFLGQITYNLVYGKS
ncbi:MAG: FHA domain-containing protein [Planctomycetota bacterium]|nr:FHA domain-containing protein [Planctomycetota bacterium]